MLSDRYPQLEPELIMLRLALDSDSKHRFLDPPVEFSMLLWMLSYGNLHVEPHSFSDHVCGDAKVRCDQLECVTLIFKYLVDHPP